MNTAEQEKLDILIIQNRKLDYFRSYRKLTNASLKDAIDSLADRYRELRKLYPSKFDISDEEYWEGFYS